MEPFCFHRENKAIVISFTSMHLAHELFGLLSGFSKMLWLITSSEVFQERERDTPQQSL